MSTITISRKTAEAALAAFHYFIRDECLTTDEYAALTEIERALVRPITEKIIAPSGIEYRIRSRTEEAGND